MLIIGVKFRYEIGIVGLKFVYSLDYPRFRIIFEFIFELVFLYLDWCFRVNLMRMIFIDDFNLIGKLHMHKRNLFVGLGTVKGNFLHRLFSRV